MICLDILQVGTCGLTIETILMMIRTNGPLYTAFRPFYFPCNHCWAVRVTDAGRCLLTQSCTEPNNASPLNPDAAALWNKPDGMFFSSLRLEAVAYIVVAYKVQLLKHYRNNSS